MIINIQTDSIRFYGVFQASLRFLQFSRAYCTGKPNFQGQQNYIYFSQQIGRMELSNLYSNERNNLEIADFIDPANVCRCVDQSEHK